MCNRISIDRVYNTKFLGVMIDDKLNWKEHITMVQSKISKTTAIIYKANHVLTKRALYILYCSLALPYMTYCTEIWGNTYRANVLPVFLKQKRLLRIVCRCKQLDYTTPLFYKMHALKLFDLIKLKTAVVMFKAYTTMFTCQVAEIICTCIFELNLNQCLYQIMGLNYGMVFTVNLKVVIKYRYSRNVLKNSICKLMI